MSRIAAFSTALAVTVLLIGCASSPSRTAPPAAPPVTAQTPFAELQAIFKAKFPDVGVLASTNGYLPRTALAFNRLNEANWAAQEDFAGWCKSQGGTLFTGPWRPESPPDVRAAVKTASNIIYVTTNRYTGEDETVCTVQGRPFVLHSKQQTFGPSGGAFTRAIAWISADDLATFGPLALQAREDEKKQAQIQASKDVTAQQAAQQAAEANRLKVLERSPLGTQLACSGHKYTDQAITEMSFTCNALGVFYADFAKYGWRMVSQHVTPQALNGVSQGALVELLVEKVR